MFAVKLILATIFVVTSARCVPMDDQPTYQGYLLGFVEEGRPIFDASLPATEESYHPGYLTRIRRQAKSVGSVTVNSDGGIGLGAKIPLAGNDKNVVSALGSVGLDERFKPASKGFGLALDNVNGHGLSVMKENIPNFGDRVTGAGKLNVFHNPDHNVDVTGSITRSMPTIPNMPNFNTYGGGVDYMYKNKVGASLGMASTPYFDRKDYSAMGNLNLFRNPTTSLDFSGGFKKFDMPRMSSGWTPNFGLTFSKSF